MEVELSNELVDRGIEVQHGQNLQAPRGGEQLFKSRAAFEFDDWRFSLNFAVACVDYAAATVSERFVEILAVPFSCVCRYHYAVRSCGKDSAPAPVRSPLVDTGPKHRRVQRFIIRGAPGLEVCAFALKESPLAVLVPWRIDPSGTGGVQ